MIISQIRGKYFYFTYFLKYFFIYIIVKLKNIIHLLNKYFNQQNTCLNLYNHQGRFLVSDGICILKKVLTIKELTTNIQENF